MRAELCGAVYGCEFFGAEEFGEDEEYAVGCWGRRRIGGWEHGRTEGLYNMRRCILDREEKSLYDYDKDGWMAFHSHGLLLCRAMAWYNEITWSRSKFGIGSTFCAFLIGIFHLRLECK